MRFGKFGRRRQTYRSVGGAFDNTRDGADSTDGTRERSMNSASERNGVNTAERDLGGASERAGGRTPSCSSRDLIYDMGNAPLVLDISRAAEENDDYRRVIWTGKHFQIVLMCIPVGGDIPFEMHEGNDQLIYVVSGHGEVEMGRLESRLDRRNEISGGSAVVIPSGTFHKVKNTGRAPLKLFTLYAPKHYPFGTRDISM